MGAPKPASIALKDYNLDDVFDDMTRDVQGRAALSTAMNLAQKGLYNDSRRRVS